MWEWNTLYIPGNLACTSWHESCLSLETTGCSLNSKTVQNYLFPNVFFNYVKSTFALLFHIGCHVNRWSQIPGMKTNSCSLGCSSAISNDVQSIKVVLLQSKVDSMQTEVMHYSIQNLKIPEIIIEFLRLELASDARWFVPLWSSSDFPSNESG